MGRHEQVNRDDRRFLAHRTSLTALTLAVGLSGSIGVPLTSTSANAVDGAWLAAPATADWNTGTNWSSTPTVPNGTASFGASNTTSLIFSSFNTAIDAMLFVVGAPAYTFTQAPANAVPGAKVLTFNGLGIVNNSGIAPTFNQQANNLGFSGDLIFNNASTAGNAIINMGTWGTVTFQNSSTAGTSTINSSGSETITQFKDTSTAGNATYNATLGFMQFKNSSNAGNAHLNNDRGIINFDDTTTAANAVIDNRGGVIDISDQATGGNATITNASSGVVPGRTVIGLTSNFSTPGGTAGNATIVNNSGGETIIQFGGTAGTATITNNNGGSLYFRFGDPDGSTARVINNVGGKVDISAVGSSGTSIGSIEGAGDVFLGSKILTLGNTNLSTQISGVISDCGPAGTGCSIFGPSVHTGGSLVKIGTGTLILSGENTYTGGTTINAGTLQLGNGGATGSLVGNIANNAALVINRSGTLTLDGVFSGAGSLTQNGTVTTTLSGNSPGYTGATTINGGTMLVNGAFANSAFTVNSGATLGGNGTVGTTTVNSGGTLSPGNSIGVINVNGNLVLGAGAIYLVEVSPTSADRVNISGTAQLGGEARLVFGAGSYNSNNYTILSAAGGRTGTFNTMTTVGLPSTLSASLSYTGTDVLLVTLSSQIAPAMNTLIGNTRNQRAVAMAQDTAFNTGFSGITALYGLSLAQLPAALDQLSGEVHPSTAGVLVDESQYVRSAVLGRLRQASYGGNTQMASLSMGGPQAFAADGSEAIDSALAYAKSPIVTKAPMRAPEASSDVVFWSQGFGARGRFDSDGNATNVRRDLAGFFSGVDTRVGANGRLGIAAGYTGSKNALDGRGSSNVETGHVSGYGGWAFGNFNLRAGGAVAWHTIDTSRAIVFPGFFDTATASYNGRTGQIFGEAGYGFAFGNVAVEPFAGGAWVRLNSDGFNERALVAGLNVAANTFEVGYSNVGIRAATMIPIGDDMVLIPRASLAWQHAFSDVTPEARLAFIAAPVPFVVAGTPIARDALLGEAGLDLAIGRNATVGVSYTGQTARNVQDHAAKGKFSWKF